jgi:hypothetical protein
LALLTFWQSILNFVEVAIHVFKFQKLSYALKKSVIGVVERSKRLFQKFQEVGRELKPKLEYALQFSETALKCKLLVTLDVEVALITERNHIVTFKIGSFDFRLFFLNVPREQVRIVVLFN